MSPEILVHIAAPSHVSDDAGYRALAAAYLAFEPATRIPIAPGPEPAISPSQPTSVATQSDEPFFLRTPNLSFEGATDNLDSPYLRGPATSWRAPPSVVADSNPDNNISIAQFCSPTRILEHYLHTREPTQSSLSQGGGSGLTQSYTHGSAQQPLVRCSPDRTNVRDAQNDLSFSVVPQSPPPAIQPSPVPASSSIPGPIGSSSDVASWSQDLGPPSRTGSEPLPAKRRRTGEATPLARSSSDYGPGQQAKEARLRPHQSLRIYSPAPATSRADLDGSSLVTAALEKLARGLYAKKYRPEKQTRDIRPLERGYWLVDCSGWPAALRWSAWGFLGKYVGGGEAGWGILCSRDGEFSRMRLYCWGAVVGHMYLLLYLASERAILHTGAVWVGAGGDAVVTMGERSR